uniref:BESS domain-containing protein n=1 Tax=Rhabditophanes sp. KR3021 TaxID=114890 RepID=A0AC35U1Y3_9BILA
MIIIRRESKTIKTETYTVVKEEAAENSQFLKQKQKLINEGVDAVKKEESSSSNDGSGIANVVNELTNDVKFITLEEKPESNINKSIPIESNHNDQQLGDASNDQPLGDASNVSEEESDGIVNAANNEFPPYLREIFNEFPPYLREILNIENKKNVIKK